MSKRDFVRRNTNSVANAEILLMAELNRRGIFNFQTQYIISFTWQSEGCFGTIINFYFSEKKLAVYLDGDEIHQKHRQEAKDELINKALERRGIEVQRFSYTAPICDERLAEIADWIVEELKLEIGG